MSTRPIKTAGCRRSRRRRNPKTLCRSRAAIHASAKKAEIAPPNRGNAPEAVRRAGHAERRCRRTDGRQRSVAVDDASAGDAQCGARPAPGRYGQKGALGNALRNLQRYVQQQSFDNPTGSGDSQGLIQFDSKGVDFGPWLRRFVAQVKRNWFVPQAAMIMKGHVVITFNIHRNGAITDIEVKQPSSIESFNLAAVNALMSSNPTQPLPRGISVGLGVLHGDVPLQRGP